MKKFRFIVALGILILGQISLAEPMRIYRTENFQYTAFQYPKFQLIAFHGQLSPLRDQNPLRGLIKKLHPTKPVIFWVLNSLGGYADGFFQTMNSLKNNNQRPVKMVISGNCNSACTHWAAMATKTIVIENYGYLKVHRTWALKKTWTIETPKMSARKFGQFGANEQWFLDNLYVLSTPQNKVYRLSKQQSLDSGLADMYAEKSDLEQLIGAHVMWEIQDSFGISYKD